MKDCCSQGIPCGLGEGDCDHDSDCENDLVCGSIGYGAGENCGPNFAETAECCRKPSKWHGILQNNNFLISVSVSQKSRTFI